MSDTEYPPIEVDRMSQLLGKRALVQWEEAPKFYSSSKDTMKQGIILRPETTKKAYFTGIVLKCGLDLTDELNEGDRVYFQQFSGFEKFSDPKYGRVAIVDESAIECVIPPREDGSYPLMEDAGTYA